MSDLSDERWLELTLAIIMAVPLAVYALGRVLVWLCDLYGRHINTPPPGTYGGRCVDSWDCWCQECQEYKTGVRVTPYDQDKETS